MPEMKRHKFKPVAVSWKAITVFAATYHSKDHVKIARRPKRSARKPHAMVPTNSPLKSAAMKLATPDVPNRPVVVGVRMPLLTRPGAM
jgi:hypothetical protein